LQLLIIREALRAHTAQFSEREIRSMSVKLGSVRADTRCAICWGTLKKVKVVSPCLHRFCQGCIEEHLRKL
jgi:E3 ubiquitin-protein ligase RNF1/2